MFPVISLIGEIVLEDILSIDHFAFLPLGLVIAALDQTNDTLG